MSISMNKRQLTCVGVEGKLVGISAELHRRSNKLPHFGDSSRSMMRDPEVLRYEMLTRQHAANSYCSKHEIYNLMFVIVSVNGRVTQTNYDASCLSISDDQELVDDLA